jgi:hypothetical protein
MIELGSLINGEGNAHSMNFKIPTKKPDLKKLGVAKKPAMETKVKVEKGVRKPLIEKKQTQVAEIQPRVESVKTAPKPEDIIPLGDF